MCLKLHYAKQDPHFRKSHKISSYLRHLLSQGRSPCVLTLLWVPAGLERSFGEELSTVTSRSPLPRGGNTHHARSICDQSACQRRPHTAALHLVAWCHCCEFHGSLQSVGIDSACVTCTWFVLRKASIGMFSAESDSVD